MSARLVSPTFVGRYEELRAVAELVNGIGRGRAGTLLVGGEAGIGKTRFCEAASEAAKATGVLVLRGASVRLGSGELPYAPIAGLLRSMAREIAPAELTAVIGADDRWLSRIASIGGRARARTRAQESPELARGRLLQALLDALGRLAGLRPILLVVEDLHWADSASLDALAFLIHSLRDERVGLLLTFRSDELHRRHPLRAWLGEIERVDTVERLELRPFGPPETREVIAAIRGATPLPGLVDAIQARSDGNPLFIEELLAVEDASGSGSVSLGLRDILLARVASVPEKAQLVLRAAAVAGRRVDGALLAEVCGPPPAAFDAALEAAVERGVLVHESASAGDWVAFRHALIEEVIDDSLLPGERIRLHRRFAEALAHRLATHRPDGPGAWAELADHWDGARDEPRAFETALRAAAEADHAYAFTAALVQYRRALGGWEVVANPSGVAGFDRIELLGRAAEAAWLSGRGGGDQVALLREAITEADRGSDAARAALFRGRLGYALWVSGSPDQARAAYEEAVAGLPPGPATPDRAWIVARLGQALMLEASYSQALRLTEEAVAMAREVGNRRVEAHALNTLACAQGELGMGSRAIASMELALAAAVELGEPDEVGRAYLNASEVLAISGLDHRALELVWQGVDRTTAMGMAEAYGSLIAIHGALIAYDLGRWAEAGELAEAEWAEQTDATTALYVLARIVPLAVGSGRWNVARPQLARMAELLERFGVEAGYSGPYACTAAELALWERRPSEALATVDWGLTRLARTDDVRHRIRLARLGMRAAADLRVVARDRHADATEAEAKAAVAALRERTAGLQATIATMDGGLAAELTAESATIAAENSRWQGASDANLWREAAARWSVRERPYQHAYACWREAEASLSRSDRPGAVQALRSAADGARGLGAEPLLNEVAALARRARISLEPVGLATAAAEPESGADRPQPLVAEFGLTRREVDVLELVARGMTNREIGAALFISVYTAGVHVSRILSKLDVASRTEAASKAYRLGIVSR